jgi:hypothetical protein
MAYHSLALLHVNLVAEDNKGEVIRVARRGLDQELVSPAVQRIETLGVVHVVDKDAAVGASVEGDAERLEAFLAGGVPKLECVSAPFFMCPCPRLYHHHSAYLHRHLPIIDNDLPGEEVCANGRLVACAELLVDLYS